MVYTLKVLSRRIAADDSDEAIKSAARRIEHWSTTGVFGAAGIDIGPKALGRGRVRRYPEEAISWCLLWSELADRMLGIVAMVSMTSAIRVKLLDRGQQGKWLRQAMRGEGPALFLLDESAGLHELGAGHGITAYKFKLARSPIQLGDDWAGGSFINLTAVYAKVATE